MKCKKKAEGATIRAIEDLMADGIAWNYPDVFQLPEFQEKVIAIKNTFKHL